MSRGPWILLLAAVVLAGAAGPAVGQAGPTPTNETVRQVDPATVSGSGDLAMVEAWLSGRLSGRLDESTAAISRGQYEAARRVLGDAYRGDLARYAGVVDDDEAVATLGRARNATRSYATATARFEATYRAYRRADARGDEAEARRHARRLVDLAVEIDRTGGDVGAALAGVENRTGADLTPSRQRVANTTRSVRDRADVVAETAFVRTRLHASVGSETVSFTDPAAVAGRLVAENGSPIDGATVRVGAPGEAVVATTNASGWFAATYRPVRLSTGPGAIPVRYAPAVGSAYLGNATAVSADVRAVTPAVSASVGPSAAGFGEWVLVRGSVSADGRPVGGVPLAVTVGGLPLARGSTRGDGTFAATGRLPAAVPAGARDVVVRVDQTGRAIAAGSTATTISVESTATALTLDARRTADGVKLSGHLRTVDGRGLADQRVSLSVAGTTVRTVETDGAGRFAATVAPDAAGGDLTATARFDGAGTNLEGASATAPVPVAETEAASADGGGGLGWWPWLGLGGLLALGLGGWWWWRQRGPSSDDGSGEKGVAGAGRLATAEPTPVTADWRASVDALLAAGEPDRAVEAAYGALRRRLADELDLSGALTHWEVYAACAGDGLSAERVEAIRAVTEAYERARFAPTGLAADEAGAVVDRAADAM